MKGMATMDENVKSNTKGPLPIGLKVTLVLTALMVYRVMGIPIWGELGRSIPQVWAIPFSGDAFVGLTALIVTYLLWKRPNLMSWAIGIAFHVIGIKDISVAGQLYYLAPNPMMPSPTVWTIFMSVVILVHLICITLLYRNRDYYLKFDKR